MDDDDRRELRYTISCDVLSVGREVPIEDAVNRLGAARSDFGTAHAGDEFVGIGIEPPFVKDHHLAVLSPSEINGVFVRAFGANEVVGRARDRRIDAGILTGRFGIGDKCPNLDWIIDILQCVICAVRVNNDQGRRSEYAVLCHISTIRVVRRNQRARHIPFEKIHRFGLLERFVDASRSNIEMIAVE